MHVKRILISLVVLAVAFFGCGGQALACDPVAESGQTAFFSDVPTDHWAYAEIMALHQRGVITGYSDGAFEPDGKVSRAEFAKMMVLALDLDLAEPASPTFADVPTGAWAYRYVETARYYLTGFRTSRGDFFKPDNAAVREDMAVALVKALECASEAEDEGTLAEFSDQAQISTNLREYVATAVREGIMEGYPESGGAKTFRPLESLTRAEAAVLLYRVVGEASEVKVTYDSGAVPPAPDVVSGRPAPVVTAAAEGAEVIVEWEPISDSHFQGYKVVISKDHPEPAYPEDGYLYFITNRTTTSATVDNVDRYNYGDFGDYLVAGQAYYFSVTAIYDDCKVAGNAVRLVYPGP